MDTAASKLKAALVVLVTAGPGGTCEVPKVLYRHAAAALRNAGGGRLPPVGAERDLVQDLLLKLLARREELGVDALVREWEAMAPRAFEAYVKKALRNLAVEGNPVWDLQRALRDVVKGALEHGLPEAGPMPVALERHGRFDRGLVGKACAGLVATGTAADLRALTSKLMTEYAVVNPVDASADVDAVSAKGPDVSEVLSARAVGAAIAQTFLAEEGEAGRTVLLLRKLGFKEMARRLGTALATAHARFVRVEHRLKCIAERVGGDRDAMSCAVELLASR